MSDTDVIPQKFDLQKVKVTPISEDAPAKFDLGKVTVTPFDTSSFTANPKGEGLYRMLPVSQQGYTDTVKEIKVPFSQVENALQSGYQLHLDEQPRYKKDFAHQNEGPSIIERATGAIQSALQPVPNESSTAVVSNTDRAVGRVLVGVPGFLKDLTDAFVHGTDKEGRDFLSQVDPFQVPANLQKQFQEDYKKDPNLAVSNLKGAIVGMGLVGAITHAATEAIPAIAGKAKSAITNTPRAILEAVTDTSPRQVREIAEETQSKNIDAAKEAINQDKLNDIEHRDTIQNAWVETKRLEDLHEAKEKNLNEEAQKKLDANNEQERQKVNEARLKQLEDEGKARLDVLEANKAANKNYEKDFKKIKADNEADYRSEVQRQNIEGKKKSDANLLKSKADAAFRSARSTYNKTWNLWRKMVANIQAPMQSVVDVIKERQKSMNTDQVAQFRDILKATKPSAEDVAGVKKIRDDLVKESGYTKKYEQLNPHEKQDIDRRMAEMSENGDLDDVMEGDVKDVSAERLHGWKSQLEVAVRQTKDSTVRFAVSEVLKAVRQLELDVSKKVPGAEAQLVKARAITGPYFDAFFKGVTDKAPEVTKMLKAETPEETRARADRERVERIAAYDPSINAVVKRIDNYDAALKAIEKTKVKVSGSHVTGLKDLPTRPTPASLPQGKPLPEFVPKTRETIQIPKPTRLDHPDRPKPVVPEVKTITPEDYQARQAQRIKATAKNLRATGLRRALYATLAGLPFAVFELFKGMGAGGAGEAALGGVAAGGVVLAGSHMLANLLDRPDVVTWLKKVTDKDVAAFEKLSPDQKALFTQDMKDLVQAAKKKKIDVSPALKAFVAGTAATVVGNDSSKKKASPKDLLTQARDLQSSFYKSGYAPSGSESVSRPAPGPQSSVKITHKFNPATGEIEAA